MKKKGMENKCTICGLRPINYDHYTNDFSHKYCLECFNFFWDGFSGFPEKKEDKLFKIKENMKVIWVDNRYGNVEKYEEVRKFLAKKHEESEELIKKKKQLELNKLMQETDKLLGELK